ncbi:MAG: hypothetical protein O3A02_03240 [bacterium]|nr:hypothetical protein [bacterium]
MPNAKQPRRRRRKAGDLAALRRVLWEVLARAEALTTDEWVDADTLLKGSHAVASLAGVYLRALTADDLAARVESLEQERSARDELVRSGVTLS